jgi:lipopolysaccharide transport system permease protein
MVHYLRDIWQCRYFWLTLVHIDLRIRYQGSGLGLGWSLARPLAMSAILCVVFHRVFSADIGEYGPYLLTGFACWNYLSSVLQEGCTSLLRAEAYIRQHRAPLAIYPLRTALGAGVHFVLALAITLGLVVWIRGLGHSVHLLGLVPGLVLLFLFGWSCAAITGLVNVHFRDTQHLCDVALQMLFYLTPVMYPGEMLQQRGLGWLVAFNPLASFLDLVRAPILDGRWPSATSLGAASLTVGVVGAVAVLMLLRLQRRIVFYF